MFQFQQCHILTTVRTLDLVSGYEVTQFTYRTGTHRASALTSQTIIAVVEEVINGGSVWHW